MTDATEKRDNPTPIEKAIDTQEKMVIDSEDMKDFRSCLYSHKRVAEHFKVESAKYEAYVRTFKKQSRFLEEEISNLKNERERFKNHVVKCIEYLNDQVNKITSSGKKQSEAYKSNMDAHVDAIGKSVQKGAQKVLSENLNPAFSSIKSSTSEITQSVSDASGSLNKAIKQAANYADRRIRWTWIGVAVLSGVLASVITNKVFMPKDPIVLSDRQIRNMNTGYTLHLMYEDLNDSQIKAIKKKLNMDLENYLKNEKKKEDKKDKRKS